ncbi:MAG: GUN4 N-terminal ARM-like repeat domain-containing protein [Microcystaceae cyanobacterium]
MTELSTVSVPNSSEDIATLVSQLSTESEKKQLQAIPKLVNVGEEGLIALQDFIQSHQANPLNVVVGKAYQYLHRESSNPKIQEFLANTFPSGLISPQSAKNIDYHLLQKLLIQQDFQTADGVTRQKFCELAGETALQRKWVYFTEVEQFPSIDIHTINSLWWVYSEGKFGFSVQRKLWVSVGRDFVKLWPKINWKQGNSWTKYPEGFTWSMEAPAGHLPLLNQLRGVRVADSLFSHPVWQEYNW